MNDWIITSEQINSAWQRAKRLISCIDDVLNIGNEVPQNTERDVQTALSMIQKNVARALLKSLTGENSVLEYSQLLETLNQYKPYERALQPVIQDLENAYAGLIQVAK